MELKYLKDTDYEGNIFVIKGSAVALVTYALMWVLNTLGIFTVASHIMNPGFAISLGIFVAMLAIAKLAGLQRNRTKYVLIAFTVIFFTSINVMMTYHSILATSIPLVLSVQYRNKKIMWYTCILTMIGQFATVFLGLEFGLCNANWIMYTSDTAKDFIQAVIDGNVALSQTGPLPRPLAQFLFFVFPQWFILGCFVPALLSISSQIETRFQREVMMHRQEEQDYFTGLGNNTLYNKLLKDFYPQAKQVALIIWDIRNLRKVSDEQGPEYGDALISMMAETIKPFKNEVTNLFRIKNGRFAIIMTDASLADCTKLVEKWRENLEQINKDAKVKLTAAIGYAQTKGADCDLLVAQAEKMLVNYKDISNN